MVLLAIDLQRGLLVEDLYNYEGFVANMKKLLAEARERGVEVIYVRHDAGAGSGMSEGDWDFEFYDELAPLPGEKVFVKKVNSCFSNKELCKYLEDKGEETVIIAGLQTNYCIDASIKSAFDRDYGVIVPEGCNSTFDNDYMDGETTVRYYNEDIWESFADVVSIEEAFEVEE